MPDSLISGDVEDSISGLQDYEDLPILREMAAAGTPIREFHRSMALHAPEVIETWATYAKAATSPGAIDVKTQQMIIIGIDAALGWPHIRNHINKALDAGATIKELVDTCVTAGHIAGAHAWEFGFIALRQVLAARSEHGQADK